MLSRAANNIFWMGRYLERADSAARVAEAEGLLTLDHARDAAAFWEALFAALGEPAFKGRLSHAQAVERLLLDEANANSARSCVFLARENARGLRDALPSELVTQLNRLHWRLQEAKAADATLPEEIRLGVASLSGLAAGLLSRGEAWRMLRLGRMLERADQASRLIDVKFFLAGPSQAGSPGLEELQWSALLRASGGLEMYRQRHGTIQPAEVAAFLVLDSGFPRSISFCLAEAKQALEELCARFEERPEALRLLSALKGRLAYLDSAELAALDLHEEMDRIQIELARVSDAVADLFFNPLRMADDEAPASRRPSQEAQQQ